MHTATASPRPHGYQPGTLSPSTLLQSSTRAPPGASSILPPANTSPGAPRSLHTDAVLIPYWAASLQPELGCNSMGEKTSSRLFGVGGCPFMAPTGPGEKSALKHLLPQDFHAKPFLVASTCSCRAAGWQRGGWMLLSLWLHKQIHNTISIPCSEASVAPLQAPKSMSHPQLPRAGQVLGMLPTCPKCQQRPQLGSHHVKTAAASGKP